MKAIVLLRAWKWHSPPMGNTCMVKKTQQTNNKSQIAIKSCYCVGFVQQKVLKHTQTLKRSGVVWPDSEIHLFGVQLIPPCWNRDPLLQTSPSYSGDRFSAKPLGSQIREASPQGNIKVWEVPQVPCQLRQTQNRPDRGHFHWNSSTQDTLVRDEGGRVLLAEEHSN